MWLFFKRDILWFLQGNKWKIIGLGMLLILAILINVVNAKNASGTIADVFLSFLKQDNGAENPLTSSLIGLSFKVCQFFYLEVIFTRNCLH